MAVVSVMVWIWGLRLFIYLGLRKRTLGEDYRYKIFRDDWEKNGMCFFYTVSLLIVWIGQGNLTIIINSATLFICIFSKDNTFTWLDGIGVAVWVIGFAIEVIADETLKNHLKNPAPGSGKFIKTSVWRYSRHPNYFGEAMLWFGPYILACGIEKGWMTIFAPLLILISLRFVTGVPFPEKKYAENPEWMQYCKETNVFCLWFYKEVAVSAT